MPALLWLALLLGYFVGVMAALFLLPGPVVEPVAGRITIASAVIVIGAASFFLLQRRATARVGAGGVAPGAPGQPRDAGFARAPADEDGERLDDIAGDPDVLRVIGPRRDDPLARAPDGAISPRELRQILYDGRIEMLARPVIALPERAPAFVHVTARLRDNQGAPVAPPQYLRTVARCGLGATLDRVAIIRALQTAEGEASGDEAPVIACGIDSRSLASPVLLEGLEEFFRDRPKSGGRLVLEIDHLPRHPGAAGGVRRLTRLGIRFALKRLSAAPLDLDRMRDLGISFVRLAAPRFAVLPKGAAGAIPQLAALLAAVDQAGITLVVDQAGTDRAPLLDQGTPYHPLPGAVPDDIRDDAA
ncbi:MAG TPA: EAL domain-containing protein [Geminicoccaceae bacterium]